MKMVGGHTVLTKLKIRSKVWNEQYAWVRGYILALEDMIKDIDVYARRSRIALEIRAMVEESLKSARQTLKTLEEMEEQHDSEQGTR